MSYSTQNAHGDYNTVYHRRQAPNSSPTWWPDFGPGSADFSFQREASATQSIYENHTVHHTNNSVDWRKSLELPPTKQFRHPNPSSEALLGGRHSEVAFLNAALARGQTARQVSLNRLEARAKQVDKWVGDAPILQQNRLQESSVSSSSSSVSRAQLSREGTASLPNLNSLQCARASRGVYARHGFVGGPPQFRKSASSRSHQPLSFNKMLFTGELFARRTPAQRALETRSLQPISRDWRICPESSYLLEQTSGLPVPRQGAREVARDPLSLSSNSVVLAGTGPSNATLRPAFEKDFGETTVGQTSLAETTACSLGGYSDEAIYTEPSVEAP